MCELAQQLVMKRSQHTAVCVLYRGWGQFGPFAIALGVTFNMWITGPVSSNCINPARALGPAVVTG